MKVVLQNLRLLVDGGWKAVIRTNDLSALTAWLETACPSYLDTVVILDTLDNQDSRYLDYPFVVVATLDDKTAMLVKLNWGKCDG